MMPKILNTKKINFFKNNGYLFPIKVMEEKEAFLYRIALEDYEKSQGSAISGIDKHKSHLLFSWVNEIVHNKNILDSVEDILGPNILCWSSSFFIKEANENSFVSWHQDAQYWGLEPDDVVTAWVAISDASLETGPMEVIPKSHKWQNLEHKETFNEKNLLTRGQELNIKISEHNTIPMPLKPGEISLHHVKLAHSSRINKTNDRRIGIAIRYTTPQVKQTKADKEKDTALLVRGKDQFMNFNPEILPNFNINKETILNHKITSANHHKILMK
jgi:non-haem Fe2+, alpha-ketoglutarate-dependent halogenase